MRINILHLLFFLAPALLGAQKQAIVTQAGYLFVNHTNLSGAKAQSGDLANVQVYSYAGDSLIGSTARDFGGPREVGIPEAARMPKPAPPLYEALFFMTAGDSATIIQKIDTTLAKRLPPNLRGKGSIRYEIALVSLKSKAQVEKEEAERQAKSQARYNEVEKLVNQTLKDNKAKKLEDRTTTTSSGLKAIIFDKGNGAAVRDDESLKTDYYGCFLDGKVFDNSYLRGEPLEFSFGMMIPGYEEAVKMLNHGGKGLFFLPYDLAYGAEGNDVIPAKTNLVFYIELY